MSDEQRPPSPKTHPGYWCSCEDVGGKHRIDDDPRCRSRGLYTVLIRRPNGTLARMLGRVVNEHYPNEPIEDVQPMGQETPALLMSHIAKLRSIVSRMRNYTHPTTFPDSLEADILRVLEETDISEPRTEQGLSGAVNVSPAPGKWTSDGSLMEAAMHGDDDAERELLEPRTANPTSAREPVVWADEASPFTGAQVLDLLRENERLQRIFLECWACKASLLEPDDPPHCTDCHVDDDAHIAWEEWMTSARAEKPRMADGSPAYPPRGPVSKEECIERLCDLLGRVWEHFDPSAHEPCDCFCGKNDAGPRNHMRWQSSGQALRWIEALVERELDKRTPQGKPGGDT